MKELNTWNTIHHMMRDKRCTFKRGCIYDNHLPSLCIHTWSTQNICLFLICYSVHLLLIGVNWCLFFTYGFFLIKCHPKAKMGFIENFHLFFFIKGKINKKEKKWSFEFNQQCTIREKKNIFFPS